jgi:hypothetical protein
MHGPGAMLGRVKTRHLITHGATIVWHYGWRVYWRCVVSVVRHRGRGTFLEALW